jgi:hypothetical protein
LRASFGWTWHIFNESEMALFGVRGTGTLKRCLTLPTLLERRFTTN